MKYVSLFSGIEAATVAWEPLGWEPVCFAEFDEFPSAVLAERYPEVPNVGDVTKAKLEEIPQQGGSGGGRKPMPILLDRGQTGGVAR